MEALVSKAQPYINYQNIDDFVIEQCFPDNATIAVIGDWGTGMNDALVLLQQIARNFQPDVLLHLGDIYYSGLPSECKSHFTDLIDKAWPDGGPRTKPLVFTLDGNHDRYAGSNGGYYDLIEEPEQGGGQAAAEQLLRHSQQLLAVSGDGHELLRFRPRGHSGRHRVDAAGRSGDSMALRQDQEQWRERGQGVNPSGGARNGAAVASPALFVYRGRQG